MPILTRFQIHSIYPHDTVFNPFYSVRKHEFDQSEYLNAIQIGANLVLYPDIVSRIFDLFESYQPDYENYNEDFVHDVHDDEIEIYSQVLSPKINGLMSALYGYSPESGISRKNFIGLMKLPFDDIDPFIQWIFNFSDETNLSVLKKAFELVKLMIVIPIDRKEFSTLDLSINATRIYEHRPERKQIQDEHGECIILIIMCLIWLINCRPVTIPENRWTTIDMETWLQYDPSSEPILRESYECLIYKFNIALQSVNVTGKIDKVVPLATLHYAKNLSSGVPRENPLRYNPKFTARVSKFLAEHNPDQPDHPTGFKDLLKS